MRLLPWKTQVVTILLAGRKHSTRKEKTCSLQGSEFWNHVFQKNVLWMIGKGKWLFTSSHGLLYKLAWIFVHYVIFFFSHQGQSEDNPGCPCLTIGIQCFMPRKDSRATHSATLVYILPTHPQHSALLPSSRFRHLTAKGCPEPKFSPSFFSLFIIFPNFAAWSNWQTPTSRSWSISYGAWMQTSLLPSCSWWVWRGWAKPSGRSIRCEGTSAIVNGKIRIVDSCRRKNMNRSCIYCKKSVPLHRETNGMEDCHLRMRNHSVTNGIFYG